MRTLTRYVIIEFFRIFLLALFGMTAFMLLVGIAREAVREGLGPGPILRLLPFIVPDSMRFSIPASALLATCTVFGRMSGENEVVAVKSLGISPSVLMVPVFLIGFLSSLLAVWVNDLAVSWGRDGMSRVVSESFEQIAYGMLRTQRAFSTDQFSITVKDVVGKRLIRPMLSLSSTGATITAREAELRLNPAHESLSVIFTDAQFDGDDDIEGGFAGTVEQEIPLGQLRSKEGRSPSDFPLQEIPAERSRQSQKIRRLEYGLAANAAQQLICGDFSQLSGEDWEGQQSRLKTERYRLNRLRTEPWRRWSNGFSCFFFVLIGAPWAIQRRNSDFVTIFFLCFMPILLIYYPLMAYGVDRAKEGALPQYAVWTGNVACGLVAVWLIRRVTRF